MFNSVVYPPGVTATFTRPNNTTAYAAGDVVGDSTTAPTVLTFTGCSRTAGTGGLITSVLLVDSANQATKGQFELWLFDTTFTPDNDNAVFTPTDAELLTLLPGGVVELSTAFVGDATSGADGNAIYQARGLNIPFRCVATSLYAALVVRNAYTPVAVERFDFRLGILQD